MSIASLTFAAKAKTALGYCCIGALSIGASQIYEKQVTRQKPRTHKVAARPAPPPLCSSVGVVPLLAQGQRIDIASTLPDQLSTGFFPVAAGAFPVAQPVVTPDPAAVPEPAAIGLFGLGVFAIFRRRMNKRRAG